VKTHLAADDWFDEEDQLVVLGSDFSQKFEKSKDKVIYAASLSILVGLFTIPNNVKLLGIELIGLSDRRLEWIIWTTASFFAMNCIFRFLDERRKLSTSYEYVNEISTLITNRLANLESVYNNLERDLASQKISLGVTKTISELKRSSKYNKDTSEEHLLAIKRTLKNMEDRHEAILQQIEATPRLLENLTGKFKPYKNYKGFAGWRVLLFDLIIPFGLFVLATLIHFSDSFGSMIISSIPEQSS